MELKLIMYKHAVITRGNIIRNKLLADRVSDEKIITANT